MNIQLLTYSDKAVVLLGDTKKVKDQLKAMNGRFNPHLKHPQTGEKIVGWVFSKKHENELKRLFISPVIEGREPINPEPDQITQVETKQPEPIPTPKTIEIIEPKQEETVKSSVKNYHDELITVYNAKTKKVVQVKRSAVIYGSEDYNKHLTNHIPYTPQGEFKVIKTENYKPHTPAPKIEEKPFLAIFSGATFQGEKTFKNVAQYQKWIKQVSPKDLKGRPEITGFKVEFKQL